MKPEKVPLILVPLIVPRPETLTISNPKVDENSVTPRAVTSAELPDACAPNCTPEEEMNQIPDPTTTAVVYDLRRNSPGNCPAQLGEMAIVNV